MSSKTAVVVVLALVFGLCAAVFVHFTTSRAPVAEARETVSIVVASRDINGQTPLDSSMLSIKEVPVEMQPTGAYTADRMHELLSDNHRMTKFPILKDEPLVASKLTDHMGMVGILEPGFRAMSIRARDESGVGGWIKPNDFVDLLLTIIIEDGGEQTENYQLREAAMTKTLLRRVKVLAVGNVINSESLEMADGRKSSETLRHVTLMVSPDDANRLTLAETKGNLSMVLRRPDEDDSDSALPEEFTLADLVDGEGGWGQDPNESSENFESQLAEIEKRFDDRLAREIEAMKETMMANQGDGLGILGDEPMEIEQNRFVRIITHRGMSRGEVMIEVPSRKKDDVLLED